MGANIEQQGLALGIFIGLGLIIGLASFFWTIFANVLISKKVIRIFSDLAFCLQWGGAFFLIELFVFDYALQFYHIALTLINIVIAYYVISKITAKQLPKFYAKSEHIIEQFKQSKLYKFIKK